MEFIRRMRYELRQEPKKYGSVTIAKQDLEQLIDLATDNQHKLSLETAKTIIDLKQEINRLKKGE